MPAEPADDQPPRPSRPPRPPRRWRKPLAVAALLAVVLVAAGDFYVLTVTRDGVLTDPAAAPARPLAMVLGNRIFEGGIPSRELADRLEEGLALYRSGRARRLIVSGMARDDYDEPVAMRAWLMAKGVPGADIILDQGGNRTAASMADAAALGVRSLLVVSQAYHLPRAIYLARHAGLDAVGVPATTHPRPLADRGRVWLRETLARAETVVEVALRGVHGAREHEVGPPIH